MKKRDEYSWGRGTQGRWNKEKLAIRDGYYWGRGTQGKQDEIVEDDNILEVE